MNSLIILTIVSIVIQFVIERFKVFIPESVRSIIPGIAAIIGITLSWSTGISLFAAVGVPLSPIWIDCIITGIAFSGGSVAFNELIKLITEIRPSNS